MKGGGVEWARKTHPSKQAIAYVRAGEQPGLANAWEWQLKVDLERQIKFSQHIATTIYTPDGFLVSNSTEQVMFLELTIMLEDHNCLEETFGM